MIDILPRHTAIFRVGAIHPSLNTWSRQHPMQVARLKKEHAKIVAEAVLEARACGRWDGQRFNRAEVRVIYHFADRRRRDADNLTPKFFLDSLVEAGVLTDDDFDHLMLHLERGTSDHPAWTEIRIREEGTP